MIYSSGKQMQVLRCSCRFTSGQSELSIIIIELHCEYPLFTLWNELTVQFGQSASAQSVCSLQDLQDKRTLQWSSAATVAAYWVTTGLIRALVTNCHVTSVVQVFDGCYPISSFQTVRGALPWMHTAFVHSHILLIKHWCTAGTAPLTAAVTATQAHIGTHMSPCPCGILPRTPTWETEHEGVTQSLTTCHIYVGASWGVQIKGWHHTISGICLSWIEIIMFKPQSCVHAVKCSTHLHSQGVSKSLASGRHRAICKNSQWWAINWGSSLGPVIQRANQINNLASRASGICLSIW